MTTFQEWRVTGNWGTSPEATICHFRSEGEARDFIARRAPIWTYGPHLHYRTVTLGEWRDRTVVLGEWEDAPLGRPHPTCIDVTGTDQEPRSEWACGPECPKEA
jgi:hypothetical protein